MKVLTKHQSHSDGDEGVNSFRPWPSSPHSSEKLELQSHRAEPGTDPETFTKAFGNRE